MRVLIFAFGSILIGGGLAGVTVVGLVNSQTAAPAESPASVNSPVLEYGTTK